MEKQPVKSDNSYTLSDIFCSLNTDAGEREKKIIKRSNTYKTPSKQQAHDILFDQFKPLSWGRSFPLLLLQGTRTVLVHYTYSCDPSSPASTLTCRPSTYRLGGRPILPTSDGCTGSGDGAAGSRAMGMGMGTICVPSEEGAVERGCASIT